MTKKQLVRMHNDLAGTLQEIKAALIKYVEQDGAEWVDHGTDDSDRICYKWRDMTLGISTEMWDVDCERVSFFKFLATISQE